MTQNIDLDVSKRPDLTQSEADVLSILNEALASQADPASASADLARSLREYISSQGSESLEIAADVLWDLWAILLDVVRIVPVDHPWLEVLIAAVDDLRQQGGPVAGSGDISLKWEELPQLRMYLFDKWADPTDLDDYASESIETWKRFNSFASHLVSHGFQSCTVLAYWETAAGLETVPQDATVFECKLWVATEWLIRCGSILFQDSSSTEALDSQALASIKPGPLCEGISPRSVQRWDFWHSRLVELTNMKSSGDATHGAMLNASSLSRLEQAIAAMNSSRYNIEAGGRSSRDKDTSDFLGN